MPSRPSSRPRQPPQRTLLDYFPRPPPLLPTTRPPPTTQPPPPLPLRIPPPLPPRPQRSRPRPQPQPSPLHQQTIPDASNHGSTSPIHWGDPLVLPIDEGTTTRFYYQNVNGLKVRDAGSDIKLSSHHLWEREAAVIGLSETNIEWKQSWATNLVFQIFRRQRNHLKWCRSTSAARFWHLHSCHRLTRH
jgi:hypothetical protein